MQIDRLKETDSRKEKESEIKSRWISLGDAETPGNVGERKLGKGVKVCVCVLGGSVWESHGREWKHWVGR